jgi:hypothetical protein
LHRAAEQNCNLVQRDSRPSDRAAIANLTASADIRMFSAGRDLKAELSSG